MKSKKCLRRNIRECALKCTDQLLLFFTLHSTGSINLGCKILMHNSNENKQNWIREERDIRVFE